MTFKPRGEVHRAPGIFIVHNPRESEYLTPGLEATELKLTIAILALTLLTSSIHAGDELAKAVDAITKAESCTFAVQRGPGDAVDCKYQKGQPLHVVADKIEFYRQADIFVYKQGDTWMRTRTGTLSDPLRILGASAKVRAVKLPLDDLTLLAKSIAQAKQAADKSWTINLDADAARTLAPIEDRDLAKSATAKFWLGADGKLTKYEVAVRVIGRRGNAEVDGTVTRSITLSNVGATKIDVPAAATKAFDNK
jgi:hypothetical protein